MNPSDMSNPCVATMRPTSIQSRPASSPTPYTPARPTAAAADAVARDGADRCGRRSDQRVAASRCPALQTSACSPPRCFPGRTCSSRRSSATSRSSSTARTPTSRVAARRPSPRRSRVTTWSFTPPGIQRRAGAPARFGERTWSSRFRACSCPPPRSRRVWGSESSRGEPHDAFRSCVSLSPVIARGTGWIVVHPDVRRVPRIRVVADALAAIFRQGAGSAPGTR